MSESLLSLLSEHVAFEGVKHVTLALWTKVRTFSSDARMKDALHDLEAELDAAGVVEEQVKSALAREQFEPLFSRLFIESFYAATQERRRMFMAVIAGMVKLDETAEMQSRITRAILVLEPGDVRLLRHLVTLRNYPPSEDRKQQREAMHTFQKPTMRAELFREQALVSALCLSEQGALTPLGEALLEHLEAWK